MTNRTTAWVWLALLCGACTGDDRSNADVPLGFAFDDLFQQTEMVELEETAPHVIIDFKELRRFPDGRFLIPDWKASTVRVHGKDGKLLERIGRFGSGPGEFNSITSAVANSRGEIFVTNGAPPRVSQFDSAYTFSNSFVLEADVLRTVELAPGDKLLIGIGGRDITGGTYILTEPDGAILREFGERDRRVSEVPYWVSVATTTTAIVADRIYTATSLVYPIVVHDFEGTHQFSFGTPPPSWEQASEPKRGEFMGPASFDRLKVWLASFTMIDRIDAYRDSLIIVTHARFKPDVGSMWNREQYAFDVYTADGEKLYEDVRVPGRVLGADQYLYALVAEPPEPWTIAVYELHSRAASAK